MLRILSIVLILLLTSCSGSNQVKKHDDKNDEHLFSDYHLKLTCNIFEEASDESIVEFFKFAINNNSSSNKANKDDKKQAEKLMLKMLLSKKSSITFDKQQAFSDLHKIIAQNNPLNMSGSEFYKEIFKLPTNRAAGIIRLAIKPFCSK